MMENNTAPTVAATTGEQQQQQQQQVNSNTDKKSMTTTTSPSAQQQQQQLSLSVSFRNFDEIIPHISIQCLVKDEVDRTWYSATEISTIRRACNEMARSIPLVDCFRHEEDEENVLPSNSNTTNAPAEQEQEQLQQAVVCLRGLEHRTYEGARIRMRRKLNAWGAVDNEQDRQWDEGYVDEESLAEMYRSCTVDSMRDAQLMALRDESFVVRHGGGVGVVLREGLMVVQ